jgi:hypothetical protein
LSDAERDFAVAALHRPQDRHDACIEFHCGPRQRVGLLGPEPELAEHDEVRLHPITVQCPVQPFALGEGALGIPTAWR